MPRSSQEKTEPVKTKLPRRSDRVSLAVPILVSGTDSFEHEFTGEARTLSISRHGATIVLERKLAPAQLIAVRRVGSDLSAKARVVGQIGGQRGGYVYGVAFLNPRENLWNIGFPPLAESEKAVGRVLLECAACQTREVAYLNELETEVFEANQSLSRSCEHCGDWTQWKQADYEMTANDAGPGLPGGAAPQAAARAARGRNARKNVRVRLKDMTACIRQPGFGEEVVRVENVSRGGLRFSSPKTYYAGSGIEVAVPYTPGAANIFVPARIVRTQEKPNSELKEYGVAYVKSPRG